jgi:hypothetical protein
MAKKKKTPTRRTGGWKAHADDAIRLAALRWFALQIERSTIQLYATDQAHYEVILSVLRETMEQLDALVKKSPVGDEECPIGFVLCKDGTCAPMCNAFGDDDDSRR